MCSSHGGLCFAHFVHALFLLSLRFLSLNLNCWIDNNYRFWYFFRPIWADCLRKAQLITDWVCRFSSITIMEGNWMCDYLEIIAHWFRSGKQFSNRKMNANHLLMLIAILKLMNVFFLLLYRLLIYIFLCVCVCPLCVFRGLAYYSIFNAIILSHVNLFLLRFQWISHSISFIYSIFRSHNKCT